MIFARRIAALMGTFGMWATGAVLVVCIAALINEAVRRWRGVVMLVVQARSMNAVDIERVLESAAKCNTYYVVLQDVHAAVLGAVVATQSRHGWMFAGRLAFRDRAECVAKIVVEHVVETRDFILVLSSPPTVHVRVFGHLYPAQTLRNDAILHVRLLPGSCQRTAKI